MKILCHKVNYTFIVSRRIILLHNFQHHHFWPPILCIVPLQSRFITPVRVRPEISVCFLRSQSPFNPRLYLFNQFFVFQNISQRQQTIDPIRATLPNVSIATQPTVAGSHDFFIDLIQMAGHPILHSKQLFLHPPLCRYRS